MIKVIILIFVQGYLLKFCSVAYCEYRAYQYLVRNIDQENNQGAYLVTSTLDPVSYLAYHGGGKSIAIDLVRTWMCLGHTGASGLQICPSPEYNWQQTKIQALKV